MLAMPWFGVRTVFLHRSSPAQVYEERINVVQAESQDDAIVKAETIAKEHADEAAEFLDYVDVFEMFDELADGAEVFSLIRESDLAPNAYIDKFAIGLKRNQKV